MAETIDLEQGPLMRFAQCRLPGEWTITIKSVPQLLVAASDRRVSDLPERVAVAAGIDLVAETGDTAHLRVNLVCRDRLADRWARRSQLAECSSLPMTQWESSATLASKLGSVLRKKLQEKLPSRLAESLRT
jgi:hypothetical protein